MEDRMLRLLVVDDDEVVRDVLKLRLEGRSDISIMEAASAEEAVQVVAQKEIDLVLLDLRLLVGTEGLEVLDEIKKLKPKTQIIMLSAYGTIGVVVEAMRRGAIDFIPKDKDYEDLVVLKIDRFIRDSVLIEDRERNIKGLYETVVIEDSARKGKALETLIAALFQALRV